MFKKIILITLILGWNLSLFLSRVFAVAPKVNCIWLPGCNMDNIIKTDNETWLSSNVSLSWVWNIIWLLIQYVAVLAVISLMIAWLFYIFSGWEEEKTKKAKSWIIWSLVWVFISISALGIIKIISNFEITPTI